MRIAPKIILLALCSTFLLACMITGTATPMPTDTATPESPTNTAVPGLPTDTSTPQTPTDTPTPVPPCPPAVLPIPDWSVYCNETFGFYAQYPADAVPGDTDFNYIRIDLPFVPDTNLHEKYVEIIVQETSGACTSPLTSGYPPESVQSENVVINGINFVKQSGSDAGAGNYWQWFAYTAGRGRLCVSFDFVLHSVQALNYPTPPPEFDLAAESAIFEEISGSFHWYAP
jgi:hypothetical protein